MTVAAIVLAAGKGTRMRSELPKPLHSAAGRSLLGWVVSALEPERIDHLVAVVGHGRDQVIEAMVDEFPERSFLYAEQLAQRGTGDAAAVGLAELDLVDPSFSDDDHVLVLPGDTPLLGAATIAALVEEHCSSGAAATVVTARVDDPTGYGRIIRDGDLMTSIVEERDASAEQKRITEINGGIYCFRRSLLAPALRMISTDNAQGELYLTDVIGVLVDAGHPVVPFSASANEIAGVNDRAQLAAAAEVVRARILDQWMRQGVTVVQPSSTVIDAGVELGPDVIVHAGSVIEGHTKVGSGSVIGPHVHLRNATIGEGCVVASCVVHDAVVEDGAHVPAFSQMTRP